MEAPDKAAFYCDDRKGEFSVLIEVRGTIRETVTAHSEAEARDKVEASLENGELELFSEDFDDARIVHAIATPPMYLVTRDGRAMGVSRLQPGDEPREPIEGYESKYVRPSGGA